MIYSQLEINSVLNKGYYCLSQKILEIDTNLGYGKPYIDKETLSRRLYLLLYLLQKWNQDANQTETLNNNITVEDRDNIIDFINKYCRCNPPETIIISSNYWVSTYSVAGYVS